MGYIIQIRPFFYKGRYRVEEVSTVGEGDGGYSVWLEKDKWQDTKLQEFSGKGIFYDVKFYLL